MLNGPVATFGYPLYHLLHDTGSTWERIVLLLGVAIQWGYIGWVLDNRNAASRPRGLFRRIAAVTGFIFGVVLLLATIPMHHVGLLYKAAGLVWSFLVCGHFLLLLRNSPAGVPRRSSAL
jgi:UDP-N-acetylmuramyl pentapeptide phosphotransferase/UDP-N-acetylglucosamine-1-phosphate transferase